MTFESEGEGSPGLASGSELASSFEILSDLIGRDLNRIRIDTNSDADPDRCFYSPALRARQNPGFQP